ncbi:MAG: S-layer homology domain-containing protein [Streptococcaceae bacterium]|nr:S-layer homology domain-containing protein [Streptococcaceae bacterium]
MEFSNSKGKSMKSWLYITGAALTFAVVGTTVVTHADTATAKKAPDHSIEQMIQQPKIKVSRNQVVTSSLPTSLTKPTAINSVFPDAKLASIIAESLGKAVTSSITQNDLDNIYYLEASASGIKSITGLQYLRNAALVDLEGNSISDISVLTSMPNIVALDISANKITSISALTSLKNITVLSIEGNQIKDFSDLNKISSLQYSQLTDLYYLYSVKSGSPFKDIAGSPFKSDITWVYDVAVTTGTSATTYSPNSPVTRGQMAAFMYRISGEPSFPTLSNPFTDVSQFKSQISWLKLMGVTTGTSATKYSPNAPVTRGQMAAFLHRLAIAQGYSPRHTTYSSSFKDAKNGTQFSSDIAWMKKTGITTGTSATTFSPNQTVTRGQMAAFLHRFYNWTNSSTQNGK